jgi:hypothetical protein
LRARFIYGSIFKKLTLCKKHFNQSDRSSTP